uniref:Reverse transcriptase domain-containing protein n=1 Tax=Laticauda laticaudata TaxID=8630 RepID=A0A8C5RTL6_LATLA
AGLRPFLASQSFAIQKGTIQDCALSLLLFILTLEVLMRNIQKDEQIKGLKIRREKYKLQAFADHLVFILEEPLLSGVKNMTNKQKDELIKGISILIVKKVKYLGIYLMARCVMLKEDNYTKLTNQIKVDLERWKNLKLSLMGRIAAIKMNILPKILFLFQNIPIKLEKSFLKNLNQTMLKFIWQRKRLRIKLKLIQYAKEKGGFGLPDWELYYQAAALTWIKKWITLRNKRLLPCFSNNTASPNRKSQHVL